MTVSRRMLVTLSVGRRSAVIGAVLIAVSFAAPGPAFSQDPKPDEGIFSRAPKARAAPLAAAVGFRALLNPVLIGSATLAVLFAGWLAWKRGSALARWSAIWMTANYLPYLALALLANRTTYLYYILPVLPALAIATALLLATARLPRFVVWGYVALSSVAFLAYFPFRELP